MAILSFSEAGRRLDEATRKYMAETGCSYDQGFRRACDKDHEAYLVYFQKAKFLVTPEQVKEKKLREKEAALERRRATDGLTKRATEMVQSGKAKSFLEAMNLLKDKDPETFKIYMGI